MYLQNMFTNQIHAGGVMVIVIGNGHELNIPNEAEFISYGTERLGKGMN